MLCLPHGRPWQGQSVEICSPAAPPCRNSLLATKTSIRVNVDTARNTDCAYQCLLLFLYFNVFPPTSKISSWTEPLIYDARLQNAGGAGGENVVLSMASLSLLLQWPPAASLALAPHGGMHSAAALICFAGAWAQVLSRKAGSEVGNRSC